MLQTLTFCSLLTRCIISCACRAKHLNFQKWSEHVVFWTFWLGNVLPATTACTFFDMSTSKSVPRLVCFARFLIRICFAPQRRALFPHRNFQKCSEREVFCTFWLGNVLRAATTVCTFFDMSTSKSVLNMWRFVHLASKCASRHNGVHFIDISTSKSDPAMVCFLNFDLEMFFAPQWPSLLFDLWSHKSLEKRIVSPLCYLFAHLRLLSSHSFSSLIFSLLLFSSLTRPTSAFPSVHIVGGLNSKLPSIIHTHKSMINLFT